VPAPAAPLAPSSVEELASISAARLSEVTSALAVSTIAVTFGINVSEGTIHPRVEWPMISDLWVAKPSNMLSRYCVCLGGLLVALSVTTHYVAVSPRRAAHPTSLRAGTLAGVVGAVGLSCVGAINEHEDFPLHILVAATFFSGMGMWAVCDLASSVGSWAGASRAAGVICLATSIAAKLAQLMRALKICVRHGTCWPDAELHVGVAGLEWLSAACLIGYFYLANHAAPESSTTRVAIYRAATSE